MSARLLRGACHCGKVRLEFLTAIDTAALRPRSCDCSFCVKHGAAYISDPEGSLSIEANEPNAISEYQQGSQSARFLTCGHCGVLVAVLFDDTAGCRGAINSRCMEDGLVFGAPQSVSPQKLAAEEKRRRWSTVWTPVRN